LVLFTVYLFLNKVYWIIIKDISIEKIRLTFPLVYSDIEFKYNKTGKKYNLNKMPNRAIFIKFILIEGGV
jgi:hypothetical protein